MTPEEYKAAVKEISNQRNALYIKERDLLQDYRIEHQKFYKGDKVLVTVPHYIRGDEKHEAFISGCVVHDNGEIFYQFSKLKKDGSESSHRLYFHDKIKSIELIEKAKL